jgi:hypothetical protein
MKQMSECLTGTEVYARLIGFTLRLEVHDDGIVIELLTFWDINHYSVFYVKQHFEGQTLLPSSGNRLTRLGPIDSASPYLWTVAESSLQNFLTKEKQGDMYNIQKSITVFMGHLQL